MEGVKMLSDGQKTSSHKLAGHSRYLGSVDPITAVNWSKECGHPLFSKEWREYAKQKLMSREFAKFRADTVRRLV